LGLGISGDSPPTHEDIRLYALGENMIFNKIIICEVCHKEEATGKRWVNPDESKIFLGGIYQVCHKCGGPEKNQQEVIYPHV